VSLGAAGAAECATKAAVYPGDYDNDGDLDLLLACDAADAGNPNGLLRNELINPAGATGPYTDVTPPALAMSDATGSARLYGVSWVDLDQDGDLDLLLMTLAHGAYGGLYVVRNNLYEQGAQVRYYRLRLRVAGDARPIGTRVIVAFGPHRQLQEILPTEGFGCSPYPDKQNERRC